MSAFTGGDPNVVHHLPRDPEFLIALPERVEVLRIVVDTLGLGSPHIVHATDVAEFRQRRARQTAIA